MSETFDKDGYLAKRAGSSRKVALGQKKWHDYYFNLIGGSLHYYKDEEDEKPHGTIEVKGFKLTPNDSEGSTKSYCFTLIKGDEDYLFAAETEEEVKTWCEAIAKAADKPPAPPLTKEKKQGRIAQLGYKLKKNVGGKVATSTLGKKAIKSQLPDELTDLIKSLRKMIEKTDSPKQAEDIEQHLFKVVVKTYFLVDAKKVSVNELLLADKPLREALNIFTKCYEHIKFSRQPHPEQVKEKLKVFQKNMTDAASQLQNTLKSHLTENSLNRIRIVADYVGSPEFMNKILSDPALEEQTGSLNRACETYTAFHFYADEDQK